MKVATTTEHSYVPIPSDSSTQEMLQLSLRSLADYYNLPYDKMYKVIHCESNWKTTALNANDPYGGSVGIAQFLRPTFEDEASQLGIDNPDIHNPYQQLETMAYMWSKGLESRWSCYNILFSKKSIKVV